METARGGVTAGAEIATGTLALRRLMLTDFRGYREASLNLDARPLVLTGPNGAGKTNLLEAVSMLAPGRGLRRAKLSELARNDGAGGWAVAARIEGPHGSHEVGTGVTLDGGTERRVVRVDGRNAGGPAAFGDLLGIQWLTPQMDRLFIEAAASRRRFLDRLVFGIDPDHARRVGAYERVMRSRNRLLKERTGDGSWMTALEAQMAATAIAVAAARRDAVAWLSAALEKSVGPFPRARLALEGELENGLDQEPAVEVEQRFADRLKANRSRDAAAGGAGAGPHRTDLLVWMAGHKDGAPEMPAAQCSTGEQKALLIAIVLANARLETARRGAAPVLLLDEVAAHLDPDRRAALFGEILALNAQAWLTGTDRDWFDELRGRAAFVAVRDATVRLEE
ncbi:MAG: DNA replication/repair protein RecF [Alphaproteobacteria bacterium]